MFSKYDVYTTVQSLYCYPDSDVLKNKLNIIHPFREGNGRSLRELIRCMALHYGFTLDWSRVDRDTMLDAAVKSVVDDRAFCDVIVECVVEG